MLDFCEYILHQYGLIISAASVRRYTHREAEKIILTDNISSRESVSWCFCSLCGVSVDDYYVTAQYIKGSGVKLVCNVCAEIICCIQQHNYKPYIYGNITGYLYNVNTSLIKYLHALVEGKIIIYYIHGKLNFQALINKKSLTENSIQQWKAITKYKKLLIDIVMILKNYLLPELSLYIIQLIISAQPKMF